MRLQENENNRALDLQSGLMTEFKRWPLCIYNDTEGEYILKLDIIWNLTRTLRYWYSKSMLNLRAFNVSRCLDAVSEVN